MHVDAIELFGVLGVADEPPAEDDAVELPPAVQFALLVQVSLVIPLGSAQQLAVCLHL